MIYSQIRNKPGGTFILISYSPSPPSELIPTHNPHFINFLHFDEQLSQVGYNLQNKCWFFFISAGGALLYYIIINFLHIMVNGPRV